MVRKDIMSGKLGAVAGDRPGAGRCGHAGGPVPIGRLPGRLGGRGTGPVGVADRRPAAGVGGRSADRMAGELGAAGFSADTPVAGVCPQGGRVGRLGRGPICGSRGGRRAGRSGRSVRTRIWTAILDPVGGGDVRADRAGPGVVGLEPRAGECPGRRLPGGGVGGRSRSAGGRGGWLAGWTNWCCWWSTSDWQRYPCWR